MGLDLDPTWLFWSLIPSAVGMGLFVYGKKQGRVPQLVGGLALMIYPYFTDTVTTLLIGGGAIGAAVYYAIQAGW